MKTKAIVSVVIAVIVVVVIVVLARPSPTHYSIAEMKAEGWPGHKVSIDVARVSPFGGGVSCGATQCAFFIYDKTAAFTSGSAWEDIVVVVKRENINFTPQDGDFIRLTGELQSSDVGSPRASWRYSQKALTIYAFKVERATAPPDW